MKKATVLLIAQLMIFNVFAQNNNEESTSPYHTSFKTDGAIIAGAVGLNILGYALISNKKDLTLAELATRTKDKVPFFDRGNAGTYSEKADKDSYIPFFGSFGYPIVLMLANGNERGHVGQITALYLETMSITGALFTLAAGGIHRSRPLVYQGSPAATDYKLSSNNQRSFYAGHTAATAAASFFAAKVFSDFNPDSKAKTYVWIVAAVTPAITGYLRYKGGMHFLSDNILGYAIGAAAGILVPKWHQTKMSQKITITPQAGNGYKGMAFAYRF